MINQEIMHEYNSLTPDEQELVRIMHRLSPEGQRRVIDVAGYLLHKGTNVKPMLPKATRQYINLHKL